MIKARKVVMAAFAGSMLMGTVPVTKTADLSEKLFDLSGTVKAGIGLTLLGSGVAAIVGLGGEDKKSIMLRTLGTFFAGGGFLLFKDGIEENAEIKRKNQLKDIQKEVRNSGKKAG